MVFQMTKRRFELFRFLGSMVNTCYVCFSLFLITGSAALLCEAHSSSRHVVNAIHIADQGYTSRALVHEVCVPMRRHAKSLRYSA